MTTAALYAAVEALARAVDEQLRPAGCSLVRVGAWVWYRDGRGQLEELALPDVNLGPVDADELVTMLRK